MPPSMETWLITPRCRTAHIIKWPLQIEMCAIWLSYSYFGDRRLLTCGLVNLSLSITGMHFYLVSTFLILLKFYVILFGRKVLIELGNSTGCCWLRIRRMTGLVRTVHVRYSSSPVYRVDCCLHFTRGETDSPKGFRAVAKVRDLVSSEVPSPTALWPHHCTHSKPFLF